MACVLPTSEEHASAFKPARIVREARRCPLGSFHTVERGAPRCGDPWSMPAETSQRRHCACEVLLGVAADTPTRCPLRESGVPLCRNANMWTLAYYVQVYPSWTVSTQETCLEQAEELHWIMNSHGSGFVKTFGISDSSSGACGSGDYGNSVFSIGSPIAPQAGGRWFYVPSSMWPSGTTEQRNTVCQLTQIYLLRYAGCSSHFSPQDIAAYAQMNWTWDTVRNYFTVDGAKWVDGGDFNVNYSGNMSTMPTAYTN